MTNRILTLTAAVLAAPLSGQELPADPGDFADLVAEGSVPASKLFDRGCPSESEWSGAALEALEARAETDMATRRSLARAVGRIADCPEADRARMRDWVVGWVNTVWVDPDAPRWTSDFDVNAPTENQIDSLVADNRLVLALAPFVAEDRIQALARKIACDARLYSSIRHNANLLLARDRLEWVDVPRPNRPWYESDMITRIPMMRLETGPKCRGFEPPGS